MGIHRFSKKPPTKLYPCYGKIMNYIRQDKEITYFNKFSTAILKIDWGKSNLKSAKSVVIAPRPRHQHLNTGHQ